MPAAERVLDLPLTVGATPVLATLCGGLAIPMLLLGRTDRRCRTRIVPGLVAAAAMGAGVLGVLVDVVWRPFPDVVPVPVFVWIGVTLLGFGATVAGLGRGPSARRVLTLVAFALVVGTAAVQVNALYGYFPTLRTALGVPDSRDVDFASLPPPRASRPGGTAGSWHLPSTVPTRGRVTHVDIPDVASGFAARRASVYLPPAYAAADHPPLPVLVLIAGAPGYPQDWLTAGRLAEVGDEFAAAHQGLAPVVVLPDAAGGVLDNPLCMDSRVANAETYLVRDVPAWVTSHLDVDHDTSHWAVGGFSYGGACALQLATRAPTTYPTFLAIGGQDEPSLGTHQDTVAQLFGGDEAAFAARNPMELLRTRRYPATVGVVAHGKDDPVDAGAAASVLVAARRAGMAVRSLELPGGHTWPVAIEALRSAMPIIAARAGLVPTPATAPPEGTVVHP